VTKVGGANALKRALACEEEEEEEEEEEVEEERPWGEKACWDWGEEGVDLARSRAGWRRERKCWSASSC